MKRYFWIIILVLVLVTIPLIRTFLVTDISPQASTIKNRILPILLSRGLSEENILFSTGEIGAGLMFWAIRILMYPKPG